MTETASKTDKPPFTHTAWILKTELIRKGRRVGRWIDEGVARFEPDGSVNVYLHSLPIGGFDGRIHLAKIGTSPPDTMPAPRRPGETGGDHDDAGDAEESDV
jgi:hypothetical protein